MELLGAWITSPIETICFFLSNRIVKSPQKKFQQGEIFMSNNIVSLQLIGNGYTWMTPPIEVKERAF